MKIKLEASLSGNDIIQSFLNQLSVQEMKFGAKPEEIVIYVTNKDGKDIPINSDKIKVVFSRE